MIRKETSLSPGQTSEIEAGYSELYSIEEFGKSIYLMEHCEVPNVDRSLLKGYVYIYALINPVDGSVFYVGRTNNLRNRYRNHAFGSASAGSGLSRVIETVKRKGSVPLMGILEFVDESDDWILREEYWIKYGLEKSWPLRNYGKGGGMCKLFSYQIQEIKEKYSCGLTLSQLATEYGVIEATIKKYLANTRRE